jgi:hypothetical protein
MKRKISLHLCFTLLFLSFLSLQLSGQKQLLRKINTQAIDTSCPGSGNFVVSSMKGKEMIRHFKNTYVGRRPPVYPLSEYAWIDTLVILGMANLLIDFPIIDGFRFYFGAELQPDPRTFPGSAHQNKVAVIIVPTVPAGEKHKDTWNLSVSARIPYESSNVYINMKETEAKPLIAQFSRLYRLETIVNGNLTILNDSLSTSVWLSECLIGHIKTYIEDNKSDGLKIYPAAYSEISPKHPGQIYDNQSTFLLVPTNYTYAGREDDWNVSKNLKNTYQKLGAYNHGSLCPNACEP